MKIFCVGRNFTEHARELHNEIPEEPVIFMKPKTAYIHYQTPFYYPEFSNELHYEAELVLKVSKNGRYINERQATNYFNAITVGIDFTARDIQNELKKKGLPWEKAKAWDNSALVGEWVNCTSEMLRKPIAFSLQKNGETVQQGDTSQMLFNFNQIIANISLYFSLNIGDLIFTGTPAGVGECVVQDVFTGFLAGQKVFEAEVK